MAPKRSERGPHGLICEHFAQGVALFWRQGPKPLAKWNHWFNGLKPFLGQVSPSPPYGSRQQQLDGLRSMGFIVFALEITRQARLVASDESLQNFCGRYSG